MKEKNTDTTQKILNQLYKSQQETASTLAYNPPKRLFVFPKYTIIFIISAFIIGLLANFIYSSISKEETKSISMVSEVKNLSQLITAEAYLNIVISQEDNQLFGHEINSQIPGTGRKLLVVIPATVTAGIDLNNLKDSDFTIDEKAKTVTITISKAKFLQKPVLDFDKIETFSIEGLFRSEVDWNEGFALAKQAQEKAEKDATKLGILTHAEENASKVLQQFFTALHYQVTVKFK